MLAPITSCLVALGAILVSSNAVLTGGGSVSKYRYGSVYCEFYNCTFKPDFLDFEHATAVAAFNNTLLTQGWGILDIKAGYGLKSQSSRVKDGDTVFGAGYAEGVLTAEQVNNQMTNFFKIWFPGKKGAAHKEKLRQWLAAQEEWTNQMILENMNDPFWRHVAYLGQLLRGLYVGYKTAAETDASLPAREWYEFRILQASGSVGDLIKVVDRTQRTDWSKLKSEAILANMFANSRCSALIKVLPGFEDIFLGHSTWFRYESTARIFKTYDMNLQGTVNRKVTFSSYGGNLQSLDDFYLVGGRLAVLQTSNSIYNQELYDLVTPQSLLTWQRVQAANWLASGGEEWAEMFSRHHSGTYNNQYMVLDLSLANTGKPLLKDTLWVVEEIPGLVESRDLTHTLRAGYFPSYNIPYFDNIFNISGYPAIVEKVGYKASYELAPRAKIFRRDQSGIKTLQDMKDLLQYNDYKHDPYSENDPTFTVCARGDLKAKDPAPVGCYDTKVTTVAMARQNMADIIGGPTLGSGLPPFSWTGQFAKYSHQGLPQTYNFSFINVQPRFDQGYGRD
ncbi:phospholipase B-like [Elysia marginata]|uniref:Phospholipase B-like n=1 Tax=Elysia marginata TaxID=1093978 RepID=A0AAV4GX63_9GAST|nr:phospholipase B-like [Elysia marginata]